MFSNLFQSRNPKILLNEGLKLYRAGKAMKAVDKLSDAIKRETSKPSPDKMLLSIVHCLRGEVYLSVGVAILSQSDFVISLDYNPSNESALNDLGIWFSIERFNAPDYKRSLEYFDKAITIQPNRKDIQLNKACVKIQSGDQTGCDDLRRLEGAGYPAAILALEKYCKLNSE